MARKTLLLLPALALPLCLGLASAQQLPQTKAEKTEFKETSSYADVIQFLEQLQANGAPMSVQYIGTSTEGKRIPLVIASRPLISTPVEAKRSGRPVIYIQANIHAGEVEGKEAALSLLRKYASEPGVLDKAILLITPIYNIDGNEKWAPVERNRPGQNGPASVGVRPNGQNLDLNRDCMKAASPEMQSVLRHVYVAWDPDVIMDLHTTNGTRHGYELTYSPPLNPNTEPEIMKYSRDELLTTVRKNLRDKFKMETFDYGNAQRQGGGQAWLTFGQEGRYVTNYAGLRNRIGVLSEATSYISFKDRVVATERFVDEVLSELLKDPSRIVAMTRGADERMRALASSTQRPEWGVRFDFDMRGEENVILEKPATPPPTGRPLDLQEIKMPVFDRFKTTHVATLPLAYAIPKGEDDVVKLLRLHGIVVERLLKPWSAEANNFTITEAVVAPNAFQGVKLVRLEGTFATANEAFAEGDFLVRTAQPVAPLIFNLLEPQSLDGVSAWGLLGSEFKAGGAFPIRKLMKLPAGAVTERVE